MLVLSRKPGEALMIGGDIKVTVVEIAGTRVKVAIDAPDSTSVVRGELTGWLDLPATENGVASIQTCKLDLSDYEGVEPDVVLTT
jgi:carbon storage regulator CsrA